MDSPGDTPKGVGCPIRTSEDHRALAPPLGFSQRATSFIASRYQGIHQMPFMCCARAQPRTRASGSSSPQGGSPKKRARAEVRGQRSEDRQRCRKSGLSSVLCSLGSDLRDRCANGSPRRCSRTGGTHTHAPGPTSARRVMAGPASHGHDSLHDVNGAGGKGQTADHTIRCAHPPPQLAVPDARRRAQRLSGL
jgi:hypothetical protein